MNRARTIEAIDSHTAGEPTRIVTGGTGTIEGATMADKSRWLRDNQDDIRRALVLEPRGHDAMVLAYITEPVSPEAACGVVFANDAGYLNMCGHGTIGLADMMVRTGRVEPREPVTEVVFDTPAGQVTTSVRVVDGEPRAVTLRNVPSFVQSERLPLRVAGLPEIEIDVAYGGNWFAFVRQEQLDVSATIEPENIDALMRIAMSIRDAIRENDIHGVRPDTGAREPIDHLKIWTDESDESGPAARALTLCPGRAYDRSPCGTGTSAKVALLAAGNSLTEGQDFRSRSVLGTEFRARIVDRTTVGDRPAVVPEIEGSAWITGVQKFVLHPDDPLVHGMKV